MRKKPQADNPVVKARCALGVSRAEIHLMTGFEYPWLGDVERGVVPRLPDDFVVALNAVARKIKGDGGPEVDVSHLGQDYLEWKRSQLVTM